MQALGKSTHHREKKTKGVCKQMLKKTRDTSSQHPETSVVSRKVTRGRKDGDILGAKRLTKQGRGRDYSTRQFPPLRRTLGGVGSQEPPCLGFLGPSKISRSP